MVASAFLFDAHMGTHHWVGWKVGKPVTKSYVPSAAPFSLPIPGLLLEHQRLRSTRMGG